MCRGYAQAGLMGADQACCVCGAGTVKNCNTYITENSCMQTSIPQFNPSENAKFPREQGCRYVSASWREKHCYMHHNKTRACPSPALSSISERQKVFAHKMAACVSGVYSA